MLRAILERCCTDRRPLSSSSCASFSTSFRRRPRSHHAAKWRKRCTLKTSSPTSESSIGLDSDLVRQPSPRQSRPWSDARFRIEMTPRSCDRMSSTGSPRLFERRVRHVVRRRESQRSTKRSAGTVAIICRLKSFRCSSTSTASISSSMSNLSCCTWSSSARVRSPMMSDLIGACTCRSYTSVTASNEPSPARRSCSSKYSGTSRGTTSRTKSRSIRRSDARVSATCCGSMVGSVPWKSSRSTAAIGSRRCVCMKTMV
mmetsp:Transcript_21387/g.53343  ORF Transcript_21387/g.53343 Transcript_21387/m.53343 type:complete len:258 (-) Transcript_21387:506-1279(-)